MLFSATDLPAQAAPENHLSLDGQITADGQSVTLSWFDTQSPRVGSVVVNRRILGQLGAETWRPITPPLSQAMRFIDNTTQPGVAYEYKVVRSDRDIIDVGYWATGVGVPAVQERGRAYLVVDETVAIPLRAHLDRFERDLIGDGWQVTRILAPRDDSSAPAENLRKAASLRQAITMQFAMDQEGTHAVVLVGHVPVVTSGRAQPDGHDARAHPTDLFYGNIDGRWRINTEGQLLDHRLPSDFIELQVGRIDFANVSGSDPDREVHLLRAYFDKNHHWRQGMLGDLRNAYGSDGWLTAEIYGLRNIVGADAVVTGGHHDVGEDRPWLWGVDFGDWQGSNYAQSYENKSVFAINFGSHKQIFNAPSNPMTALLAQRWYTLAVGWGARPAWWLHHMALGGTIGDVHMRTVNNGHAEQPYRETMDYFPTGQYLWRNPIWVNLLGDPTTRAFMLAPPRQLAAQSDDQGVQLRWTAPLDPDVQGYRVYRARVGSQDYELISGDTPVTAMEFRDTAPMLQAQYMVRAYGLKDVYAGTFHTLSQGAFAQGDTLLTTATGIDISGPKDIPLALPQEFTAPVKGIIRAFIAGPDQGRLDFDGNQWVFSPPADFVGQIDLPFSVSNALQTDRAILTINITE